MNKGPIPCARCGSTMEAGFVLDRRHRSTAVQQKWVEGEVERSIWAGVKTGGREVYAVVTFRCEKCGYLESYATEPAKA